ncbi:MAG: bifunctional DNA primase/polymerase, partial [Pseudomonadota bacterium]
CVLPAGVDTRGAGGFVILPPSIHPCGEPYKWIAGPHEHALADLPPQWIEALKKPPAPPRIEVPLDPKYLSPELGQGSLDRITRYVASQTSGQRNATLYWGARQLNDLAKLGTVNWPEAERALIWAAQTAGLDQIEAGRTIASARAAA